MSQSKVMSLIGLKIIGQHGREIGAITDMLADVETWQLRDSWSTTLEREAGAKSEALAVYWGSVATKSTSGLALHVTVVDAASPRTPFTFADVTDLQSLRQEFRQGCDG